MRLRKIKLAGFKSFVDPTTLHIPSNLVGVIGPNGCGKSNVIDAVRWVMGESSAKTLRGESMADVIFNGSTSRKQVGQATVELVFDNSEGRIGGEYGQYNEISVRRLVGREGQSHYFLNGARCRRRDITELFLGTGLGPRSYSIIEQGTISRVVEARPEELRVFLEEAAGISLYKDKRKETETRMRHTRENLERLDDLRGELDSQLRRLKRQSDAALRYQQLKTEERELKGRLHALRLRTLDEHIETRQAELRDREVELEAELVGLRRTEAELEAKREQARQAGEGLNQAQAKVFEAKGEVARLEQAINHVREQRRGVQADLAQAQRSLEQAALDLEADQEAIAELESTLEENREELALAQAKQEEAQQQRVEAEQAVVDWQRRWEDFHHQAAEPERSAEVERARLNHMEQQSGQLHQRLERLAQEADGLDTGPLEDELESLGLEAEQLEGRMTEQQDALQALQGQLGEQRDSNHQLSVQLDQTRRKVQHGRGRLASLETLQQAALHKGKGGIGQWLEQQGLADAPRLAQQVQVDGGWERAVEVVLGDHLEAVCTADLAQHLDALLQLAQLEKGRVTLFDTSAETDAGPSATSTGSLAARVRAPWPLDGLLGHILTAPDLASAWRLVGTLKPYQSVVTPDGLWLGRRWLRVAQEQDEHAGVLAREQQLRGLQEELPELDQLAEALNGQLEQGNQTLQDLEQRRHALQDGLQEVNRAHSALQSRISGRRTRLETMHNRRERIEQEREELTQELEQVAEEAEQTRTRLHEALERMEALVEQRLGLEQERDRRRNTLTAAAEAVRSVRDQTHRLDVQGQTLLTRVEDTRRNLDRVQAQVAQWQQRSADLAAILSGGEDPVSELEQEREAWLARHIEREAQLSLVRDQVAELDTAIHDLDQARRRIEGEFGERKTTLQEAHIALQEQRVRRQTLAEQLEEAGEDIGALMAALPEQVEETQWQQRVEQIGRSIERLGAINLAAIEEYKAQAQRKDYLDSQHGDLTEALDTLESAIRRIDRETRERFKETYDKVNTGVQSMFPRLFGGGEAYLDLTDRDLLQAGVTIMARPPGKRNSSIHLLSGGEKALTAVALVFSIFELNPAPFCMLDEVDAPLDDANVARFGRMVQTMSDRTQFVFVTHNKVTMEMADHLTGVTMQEPGVSRLVAVDIAEAVELAIN